MSSSPDFTIVERTLANALTDIGFTPKIVDDGVETGYPLLALFRTRGEVVTVPDAPGHGAFATIEIRTLGAHPVYGKIDFRDLVTVRGDTPELALERAAQSYANTTLAALMAFFDNSVDPGSPAPEIPAVPLEGGGELGWHTIASRADVLDEPAGVLASHLGQHPPVELITDIFIDHLHRSGAAWAKIFAAQNPDGKHTFGCTINGEKAIDAEMALAANWTQPDTLSPGWEFRQFIIVQPADIQKAEAWRTDDWKPGPDVKKDHSSFATSPANTKLAVFHYARSADKEGCLTRMALVCLLLAVAGAVAGWFWLTAVMLLPVGYFVRLLVRNIRYEKEKYLHGLLVPGVVTSIKPLQVAVLAPLANSRFAETRGDAIKLIEPDRLPGHPVEVGTRVPCVACFSQPTADTPRGYWSDFNPEPLCWGTADTAHLRLRAQEIGDQAFAGLEAHIAADHLPGGSKELYLIDRIGNPPPVPPATST